MEPTDFFISHAGRDRAWAEWVAWQLVEAGYTVEIDLWDWAAGENFIGKMSDALDRAKQVVALFSSSYFEQTSYTAYEWPVSVLRTEKTGVRLVPLRIEAIPVQSIPAVLRPLAFRDLFGLDEEEAKQVLLMTVAGVRRPDGKPGFPGRPAPAFLSSAGDRRARLPGKAPWVWNVPVRNPGFTGRDQLLQVLRERLLSGDRAVVQALHGIGGVGKTQIAIEYAHRFASDYDLGWWIAAEDPALVGNQIAALAVELGCVATGSETAVAVRAVMTKLRSMDRWLLVFDNAEEAVDLLTWLPSGASGHVLITSRRGGWTEIAAPVSITPFERAESIQVLRSRVLKLSQNHADKLADALGDLPLAIVQAADYLGRVDMKVEDYLSLLSTRSTAVLNEGLPLSYPRSLAAAVALTFDRLNHNDATAANIVELCAFLAPEPVRSEWLRLAAPELPEPLAAKVSDRLDFGRLLTMVGNSSLAQMTDAGLQMHRLTQAILRDRVAASRVSEIRACAEAVVAAGHPGDPDDPRSWAGWLQILPHLLFVDPAWAVNSSVRDLACRATRYLFLRGETRMGLELSHGLYQGWRDRLGPDDLHTLWAANNFAVFLCALGDVQLARQLDEDTLVRRRRVLGPNNIHTLNTANNLALDLNVLGELHASRKLDEDTLARRRRVLGREHPHTLTSANNLAVNLRCLGESAAAYELDKANLALWQKVKGHDDPGTMRSVDNLASDLFDLGQVEAACDLHQDNLARRRRVLGHDHPHTLNSATSLASCLRALGQKQAARELIEDTLVRRRRVLGSDHPDTLALASILTENPLCGYGLQSPVKPESSFEMRQISDANP